MSNIEKAPRWIVIAPTPAMPDWLEAIQIGAQLTGNDVLTLWSGSTHDEIQNDYAFVVTDDAALAQKADAGDIVGLMPDPESAIDAIEFSPDKDFPASGILASQRLAEISSLAGQHHRLITSTEMRTPGAALELYSDLVVKVPPSVKAQSEGAAKAAFEAILGDLYSHGVSDKIVSNWPVEVFNHHTTSLIDGQLGAFDLTGRPRFLITGPYIWLATGTWTAKVRFSVDEDACGRRLRIDWGSVDHWTEQHFTPEHAGIYEMELPYTFEQPQPCEMRVLITEGCFTGRLDLLSVTISKD